MKNLTITIVNLIDHVNNIDRDGGYWLPNIQRHFVWNEDQITKLYDSLMRKYPISTMLAWRTNESIKHRSFIKNYKLGMGVSDCFEPTNEHSKYLILDGQQRMQSLYIGLRGSIDAKELYLNILSGTPASPEDISYKFAFMKKDNVAWPWVKFKDIIYASGPGRTIRENISNSSPSELTQEDKDKIEDNVETARDTFKTDPIITIQILDSIAEESPYKTDDVVEIFIRANSGGTKLTKSDLLFSLLSSSWPESEDKTEELLEKLNHDGFSFDRDFIIKTNLTLLKKGSRYDVNKLREESTRTAIIEKWDDTAKAILDVKDFLTGKTFIRCDKNIPSYLVLIPVIYFRYHHKTKWSSARGVRNYILRCLVSSAFSGSPDTLIDKITAYIDEKSEFDKTGIYGILSDHGRSLKVSRDNFLSIGYESNMIHLLFAYMYNSFKYTPSFHGNSPQIDHIFPQSLLKKERSTNPETGKNTLTKYKKAIRDQISNCMLLTQIENGPAGKRDTPPHEWFSDKNDEYLELHLIPKDKSLWHVDKFDAFVDARKQLLLEKFKPWITQAD
jgi:hypothetical protein